MQPMGGQQLPMDDGKIFVGGLHPSTTQDSLKNYFLNYGEVIDCVLMVDNVTKRSRGFGFVTFKDTSSVAEVSSQTHILDGKQIDPKRAVPKGPGQSMVLQRMGMAQPGRNKNPHLKIFVGGISQTTTVEHVKQYFSPYGNVLDVKMPTDKKTGNHRGFAFVGFDSPSAPQKAQATPFHQINGKTVEVKSLDDNALRYNSPLPPMNGQYMGAPGGEGYGQVGAAYQAAPGGGYPYQTMGQQPSAYGQAPGATAPPTYGYPYGAPSAYGGMGAGAPVSGATAYSTAGGAQGAMGQGRVDSAAVSAADYGSYSGMYGFGNYAQEASSYGPARSYSTGSEMGSYAPGTVATGTYGADARSGYSVGTAAAAAVAAAQNPSANVPPQLYQDPGFGRGGNSARGFHPYGR